MKKLLLSAAVFTAFSASSQILSEDFTNAASWTPATAWSVLDVDGDTYTWGIYNLADLDAPFDAQGIGALSFSYGDPDQGEDATPLTPDNFLISPPIDLTGVTAATLTYKVGTLDADYAGEHYSVYAVADIAMLATATPLFTETLTASEATTLPTRTVNLDALTGANSDSVYVVFRHHNVTDMYAMMIDDIVVDGTAGVNENVINASVFPNPANNVLNVTASEAVLSVTITTMDGKVVAHSAGSSVNVAELNAGMYIYNVVTVSGNTANGTFAKN